MQCEYFWHISNRTEKFGAGAFARVRPEGQLDVMFLAGYPLIDRDEALQWLGFRLDGIVACSDFEWWSYDDLNADERPDELTESDVFMCKEWVTQLFDDADKAGRKGMITLEAARTGSPSGRAGSGEPPTPAAG